MLQLYLSILSHRATALLGRRFFGSVRDPPARDLTDQVVIVTGASSGLGAELARELGRQGASLVLACRNPQAAANVQEQMRTFLSKGAILTWADGGG